MLEFIFSIYSSLAKRPMLISAVSGCILVLFTFFYRKTVLFIAVGLILVLAALVIFRADFKKTVVVACCIFITVSLMGDFRDIDAVKKLSGQEVTVTATVTDEPDFGDTFAAVQISVKSYPDLPENTRLWMYYEPSTGLSAGDRFEGIIRIQAIDVFDGGFENYSNGVYATARLISTPQKQGRDSAVEAVCKIRSYIKNELFGGLSFSSAATLNAIVLGDKAALSDELYGDIKTVGVSHVMAVSGLHLSIIMGQVFRLTDRFYYNKYLQVLLSLLSVVFIVAVCGFTKSVIRAAIMFVISSAAPLFGRESDSLSSLCATVTVLLIYSPLVIFNLAFQLSALATFGVVVLAPFFTELICSRLKSENMLLQGAAGVVSTSVFASLMTVPIVVYRYRYVSLISVIANLLITHAVTVALVCSVLAVTLGSFSVFGAVSKPIMLTAGYCAGYINGIIKLLADAPFAAVSLKEGFQTNFVIALSVVLIFALLIFMHTCKCGRIVVKSNKEKRDADASNI